MISSHQQLCYLGRHKSWKHTHTDTHKTTCPFRITPHYFTLRHSPPPHTQTHYLNYKDMTMVMHIENPLFHHTSDPHSSGNPGSDGAPDYRQQETDSRIHTSLAQSARHLQVQKREHHEAQVMLYTVWLHDLSFSQWYQEIRGNPVFGPHGKQTGHLKEIVCPRGCVRPVHSGWCLQILHPSKGNCCWGNECHHHNSFLSFFFKYHSWSSTNLYLSIHIRNILSV